jgi:hypothetical protein
MKTFIVITLLLIAGNSSAQNILGTSLSDANLYLKHKNFDPKLGDLENGKRKYLSIINGNFQIIYYFDYDGICRAYHSYFIDIKDSNKQVLEKGLSKYQKNGEFYYYDDIKAGIFYSSEFGYYLRIAELNYF